MESVFEKADGVEVGSSGFPGADPDTSKTLPKDVMKGYLLEIKRTYNFSEDLAVAEANPLSTPYRTADDLPTEIKDMIFDFLPLESRVIKMRWKASGPGNPTYKFWLVNPVPVPAILHISSKQAVTTTLRAIHLSLLHTTESA